MNESMSHYMLLQQRRHERAANAPVAVWFCGDQMDVHPLVLELAGLTPGESVRTFAEVFAFGRSEQGFNAMRAAIYAAQRSAMSGG